MNTCTKTKGEAAARWYQMCTGFYDDQNKDNCGGHQVLNPYLEK